MYTLRTMVNRGWYPALITVIAVLGYIYRWPIEYVAPTLIIILAVGLVATAIRARERRLEQAAVKLRQLAQYFNRRFTGDSTLSIFLIIDSVFTIENPKLWDWARACDMSQRIFNSWCDSFSNRLENDIEARRFPGHLDTYLNELWLIVSRYYDFVEQFYEVAEKVEMPEETLPQYHKFVMEYNAFVQNFQDTITDLKSIARTSIEPPSVKLAPEVRY